jgi:hypothetical protein
MGKRTRIVLYALSLVTMLAMVTLIIFSHGRQSGAPAKDALSETDISSTEEPVQIPEAEEAEETEAADGQNGIQNDTEQEETDKQAEAGNTEGDGSTTLIFAGDVLFANAFKSNYDAGGIEKVIEPQLLQELQDADIFMVNNEFPFSNRGEPMEDKQFTFCCDPKYVKALNEMGVDIVSLANNHTLDYGRDALSDTFTTLDGAGILYAGAGETKERAYELQIIEKNGKKFGFLAASRVVPESNWKVEERTPGMLTAYDDTKLVQLIKEARSGCDFLSVYIHWGVEYDAYPQDYQTKIATDCFNAGADLILGAHTHCLQGISYISGKPVFYSLGNFVFGQNIDKTAAVKVQVSSDGTVSYGLLPVYAAGGTTKLMDTNSASALYQYMTQISDGVTIGADGKIN